MLRLSNAILKYLPDLHLNILTYVSSKHFITPNKSRFWYYRPKYNDIGNPACTKHGWMMMMSMNRLFRKWHIIYIVDIGFSTLWFSLPWTLIFVVAEVRFGCYLVYYYFTELFMQLCTPFQLSKINHFSPHKASVATLNFSMKEVCLI